LEGPLFTPRFYKERIDEYQLLEKGENSSGLSQAIAFGIVNLYLVHPFHALFDNLFIFMTGVFIKLMQ
jgi:hypothetical protein